MNMILRWVTLVLMLLGLGSLLGCGPTAWGVQDGKVRIVLRPAIVWKVNTGLYFYGGEEPMLEVNANADASGTVEPD